MQEGLGAFQENNGGGSQQRIRIYFRTKKSCGEYLSRVTTNSRIQISQIGLALAEILGHVQVPGQCHIASWSV